MTKDHHDLYWTWEEFVASMDGNGKIIWAKNKKCKLGMLRQWL